MNIELIKCANCDAILSQYEYRAMVEEKQEEWCCYECVGVDEEDYYTTYGKYRLVLKFLKEIARRIPDRTSLQLCENANTLLKELKEL